MAEIFQIKAGWMVEGEGMVFGPFASMWKAMSATPFFLYHRRRDKDAIPWQGEPIPPPPARTESDEYF